MKYIMLVTKEKGIKRFCPIIFPSFLIHKDVADSLTKELLNKYVIYSAGEISPLDMEARGSSSTLKNCSDVNDTFRIKMADFGGLIE